MANTRLKKKNPPPKQSEENVPPADISSLPIPRVKDAMPLTIKEDHGKAHLDAGDSHEVSKYDSDLTMSSRASSEVLALDTPSDVAYTKPSSHGDNAIRHPPLTQPQADVFQEGSPSASRKDKRTLPESDDDEDEDYTPDHVQDLPSTPVKQSFNPGSSKKAIISPEQRARRLNDIRESLVERDTSKITSKMVCEVTHAYLQDKALVPMWQNLPPLKGYEFYYDHRDVNHHISFEFSITFNPKLWAHKRLIPFVNFPNLVQYVNFATIDPEDLVVGKDNSFLARRSNASVPIIGVTFGVVLASYLTDDVVIELNERYKRKGVRVQLTTQYIERYVACISHIFKSNMEYPVSSPPENPNEVGLMFTTKAPFEATPSPYSSPIAKRKNKVFASSRQSPITMGVFDRPNSKRISKMTALPYTSRVPIYDMRGYDLTHDFDLSGIPLWPHDEVEEGMPVVVAHTVAKWKNSVGPVERLLLITKQLAKLGLSAV